MPYLTDSHFVIGFDHKVCQDYTLSGISPGGIPFIVMADGCSQSHDSDFGARVLVKAAVSTIDISDSYITDSTEKKFCERLFESILKNKIAAIMNTLSLDISPFFATIFVAFISNGRLFVYGRGDGTVSIKYRDTTGVFRHTITNIKYTPVDGGSAPYYLAYKVDPHMNEGYMKQYNLPLTYTTIRNDSDGVSSTESVTHPCDKAFNHSIDLTGCFLEHVMLSSDGLESYFTFPGKTPVSYNEMVERAIAYKNTAPGFVTRRLTRMELEDQKNNIRHSDDVSIATMIEVSDVIR